MSPELITRLIAYLEAGDPGATLERVDLTCQLRTLLPTVKPKNPSDEALLQAAKVTNEWSIVGQRYMTFVRGHGILTRADEPAQALRTWLAAVKVKNG